MDLGTLEALQRIRSTGKKRMDGDSVRGAINLDHITMTAIQTAPHGVVNNETVFNFRQHEQVVTADYVGGKIMNGYLVGLRDANRLTFSYCQLQTDGRLDHGHSQCEVAVSENGRIRITEHFAWGSRGGDTGVNILEEL